jgi:hypothetical protein
MPKGSNKIHYILDEDFTEKHSETTGACKSAEVI